MTNELLEIKVGELVTFGRNSIGTSKKVNRLSLKPSRISFSRSSKGFSSVKKKKASQFGSVCRIKASTIEK